MQEKERQENDRQEKERQEQEKERQVQEIHEKERREQEIRRKERQDAPKSIDSPRPPDIGKPSCIKETGNRLSISPPKSVSSRKTAACKETRSYHSMSPRKNDKHKVSRNLCPRPRSRSPRRLQYQNRNRRTWSPRRPEYCDEARHRRTWSSYRPEYYDEARRYDRRESRRYN